ncbi:hypothetical protein [Frankia tisae]|nr:hypothetical protein [Frankia tisae]
MAIEIDDIPRAHPAGRAAERPNRAASAQGEPRALAFPPPG